jgi:methylmalonyl-CoA mutase cobalamin-binding subunit
MRNASQTNDNSTTTMMSDPPPASGTPSGETVQATKVRPWTALLEAAIENEVLPRLCGTWSRAEAHNVDRSQPSETDLTLFIGFILDDDLDHARALAEGLTVRGVSRHDLLHGLLGAAAKRLGELWDQDRCDITVVSLGMIRLNQILRDTAEHGGEAPSMHDSGRSALIAPAPGETHNFGVVVLDDIFTRAGWQVDAPSRVSSTGLLVLAKRNWYDLVGISVSAERFLRSLPATIRTLRRAARNPALVVLVGGQAFIDHPERAQFIGADGFAPDGETALMIAHKLCAKMTQGVKVAKN